METVVQIITENCAAVEARAEIKLEQFQNTKKSNVIMRFRADSNRVIYLFGLPACRETLFDLLRDEDRIAGFRIGDTICWLRGKALYRALPSDDDSLQVEVFRPKIEHI